MTSENMHPDTQRLCDVTRQRAKENQASLNDALAGWVDSDAVSVFGRSYARWVQEQVANDPVFQESRTPKEDMIMCAYLDGFLLGAMFQAAGGHREADTSNDTDEQ